MKNNRLLNQSRSLITTDHLRRLAIVYIRQSTERQVRENTGSTDYQRSLAEVARSYGWPDSNIRLVDEDLGRSGSSSKRRTGWQRLETLIAAKQVGAVFAASVSRLSRQVLDFELFRTLAAQNHTLLYCDGRFVDPTDANDTIVVQMSAMVAQFENHKRTETMRLARLTKARQGKAVSALPVGWISWIKGPGRDREYTFDPEVKETIQLVFATFFQTKSIRRTVKALTKAGIEVPARRGWQLCRSRPMVSNVSGILKNPAYAGTYVFGRTESQRGGMALASGHSKRIKLPEDLWIKIPNHHPAYITQEQHEEIKSILKNNSFERHDRPGRGAALSQGLLRCKGCGEGVAVSYTRTGRYRYQCCMETHYATKCCTQFTSNEFDQLILREVFKVLKSPPHDMLRSAFEASRKERLTQLSWIESERERLDHEERRARQRADLTEGNLPHVHRDALAKLNEIMEAQATFEQKIAIQSFVEPDEESGEELEKLCQLASEVPTLWHHAAVTYQERKEILRCVIDHIVVAATKEKVEATIFWKSGGQTPITMYRPAGRCNLIRELHMQGLRVSEIQARLTSGDNSTGQVLKLTATPIYRYLKKLNLRRNAYSATYVALQQKALELHRAGHSFESIARQFDEQGLKTLKGKRWTGTRLQKLYYYQGHRSVPSAPIHQIVMEEARTRGLSYSEMAREFNEKQNIHRQCGRPWTARSVGQRWNDLNRRGSQRASKGLTTGKRELPANKARQDSKSCDLSKNAKF